MRTCFHYSSTFEHDNPIGMLDGTQAMCYHNNRLAFVKFRQILYDRSFVIRIQRIRGLIQKDKTAGSCTPLARSGYVVAEIGRAHV